MLNISVIIVNYNTADFLTVCLHSVFSQTGATFDVWVVDNASSDKSVQFVHEQFPQVHLLVSPENLGFAKANNMALEHATGEFIFYLNPDTQVQPDCFRTMLQFMETNPSVGMAGTRLLYPDYSHQNSVEASYPSQRYASGELTGLPGSIAWLLGASLFARRKVMNQVHGFCEAFFLYGEDIDLSIKVRQAGWELGFIPEAEVIHWEGKSEINTVPLELIRKKLNAAAILYQQHYSSITIRRICLAKIRQARWRLLTLSIERLIAKDKTNIAAKIERYKLILSFFQALLPKASSSEP
jgi:hypothetical protein